MISIWQKPGHQSTLSWHPGMSICFSLSRLRLRLRLPEAFRGQSWKDTCLYFSDLVTVLTVTVYLCIFFEKFCCSQDGDQVAEKTSSTISAQHLITTRPDKARLWLSNKHQTVFCIFWWAPCPVHEGIGENSSCRLPVPEAVTV